MEDFAFQFGDTIFHAKCFCSIGALLAICASSVAAVAKKLVVIENVSYNGDTNVGHGTARTLFLGLIVCLVPMTPCDTMLYWLSPN